MRNVLSPQLQIGQTDIANIAIDVTSRDDIPLVLLGLQHIYSTEPLKQAVFKILEEVTPFKTAEHTDLPVAVATDKGRPGMDQWAILVLGALRLGLNADYDRIQELANQHRTLRMMLGHGLFDEDKVYHLQTLKDNLKLFTPDIMARINTEIVRAGYQLLDLDVHALIRGRCDSFVLKTDVHFPTDINLLYDAIRILIRLCVNWSQDYTLPGWRQHRYNLRQFKKLYRKIQKLRHSTSKNATKKQAREALIREAHQDYIDLAQVYLNRVTDSDERLKNTYQVPEAYCLNSRSLANMPSVKSIKSSVALLRVKRFPMMKRSSPYSSPIPNGSVKVKQAFPLSWVYGFALSKTPTVSYCIIGSCNTKRMIK